MFIFKKFPINFTEKFNLFTKIEKESSKYLSVCCNAISLNVFLLLWPQNVITNEKMDHEYVFPSLEPIFHKVQLEYDNAIRKQTQISFIFSNILFLNFYRFAKFLLNFYFWKKNCYITWNEFQISSFVGNVTS